MNIDDRRLLASIVAGLEVVFTPFRIDPRKPVDKAYAAVWERRAAYRNGHGLAWTIGGDGRDRQRGYVGLKRLQSAGLIRIHPGKRVQRSGISLRRVDACLSVCPINLTVEAWPILEHLAALHGNPDVLRNCDFIQEHDVVGLDRASTDGTLAEEFTTRAMPLLIAGFVETATDAAGAIGWRLTETGRDALAAGKPEPDEHLEYDPSLADEYLARVSVGLADRNDWVPLRQSVTIPLGCGSWMTAAQWTDWRRRMKANAGLRAGAVDG